MTQYDNGMARCYSASDLSVAHIVTVLQRTGFMIRQGIMPPYHQGNFYSLTQQYKVLSSPPTMTINIIMIVQ